MFVNMAKSDDPPGDHDFEEIEIAEEELIDAYVRGELSFDEQRLLEKGLRSSPELVERLHFARLLADAADRNAAAEEVSDRPLKSSPAAPKTWWPFGLSVRPRPAFQMAFAACALIIVIGGTALLTGWLRLRRESQRLADRQAGLEREKSELQKSASEQRVATEQLRTELKEERRQREADEQRIAELVVEQNQKASASSPTIATLFLPRLLRSGPESERKLSPPAGTSKVRLLLAVESIDYQSFLVEVKNQQDKVVFPQKVRPPRSGKVISVTIPSSLLPAGAYSVQVSGISTGGSSELVGNYSFRITLKN
jgi:negative regulator of sigma E activity